MQFTGWRQLRQFSVVALLIAATAQTCTAKAASGFYLGYRQWQPYAWPEQAPSASDVSRTQRLLGWRRQAPSGDIGFDYDYQPLRIRTGAPAHNGHLHRLMVGGQWQHRRFRVEARAGVAGTSNMFKYRDFHSDVINGRIALFRSVGRHPPVSLGIGGDHRFGSFRWLPRLRWEDTSRAGHWLVDLPVLLRWQGPGNRWAFQVAREGDRWATLDATRELESALYLREWRTELSYRVSDRKQSWPAVVVGIGASIDTRVRYQDLEAGTVDLRLGDAIYACIKLDW
ncbi:hypothetical protein LPB19_16770 [Marinobacter salinisoli]|uniref:Uncharacterized protein n=1 Tax=Marinobacter salinisoli TaxID=2769486 RepID=A0ABX7MR34_9GAMM|nr:hypothetical protein [Marinobacter salinisoli]QSP94800.1 hypothetical protein LPB19_16770 [Marinobacter salinisoli]